MHNRDVFGSYHPLINFLYFGIVFTFVMLSMHPVCLLISVICASAYYIMLKGQRAVGLFVRGVIPLFLLTVIINPAFSHKGVTILTYLPSGNPLTLESIIYGIAAGIMIIGILLWFACFTEVFTSDKFVYLFGRIIPALSLILSMTLRFVPRFIHQFDVVRDTQKTMGRDTNNGNLFTRIKNIIVCFSIVITWSMENAIETSDSMKSRGYGTKKRTAYSIYKWDKRDCFMLGFLLICGLVLLVGGICGKFYWRYFPDISGMLTDPATIIFEIVFLILCITPIYLEKKEKRIWNYLQSNI